MKIHSLALALAIGAPLSASAFAPTSTTARSNVMMARSSTRRSAAVVDQDLMSVVVPPVVNDKKPTLPQTLQDRKGVALSGLQGKALEMADDSFPKAIDIRKVIPEDCFEPETAKSLGYLSVSLVGTAICSAGGVALLGVLNPANPLTWPFWTAYSAVTGTVAMGLWVLAHECGHGKFLSKIEAIMLVSTRD